MNGGNEDIKDAEIMLSEENWEIIKKSQEHIVYKKYGTEYDFIEIKFQ
jgi:hypothetical protein